jgi:type I restriction enzyme M protein
VRRKIYLKNNIYIISAPPSLCGYYSIWSPSPSRTEIVARIEEKQKLVDANKKLIEIFEGKIKEKIAEVWG